MNRTITNRAPNGKGLEELAEIVRLRAEIPKPAKCRAIRKNASISAAELARVVGVSEVAICAWERGTRTPAGVNRERYAAALRVLQNGTADAA